jgi:acyl dehydratase
LDHEWSRTVTEMGNVMMCRVTMNVQPVGLDEEFAVASEFGKPLVNSLYTLGPMIGMSVNNSTFGTTIGNLGMSDAKFPTPVCYGGHAARAHEDGRGACEPEGPGVPRLQDQRGHCLTFQF